MKHLYILPFAVLPLTAYADEIPPPVEPPFIENVEQANALMQILDYAVKNCGLICNRNVVFFQNKLEALEFPKKK